MKKNVLAFVFAVVMVMSFALVGCGKGDEGTLYNSGTYSGEGQGLNGAISVTLTIASDEITVDEITDPGETAGVGGKEAIADGTYKSQIEAAQSAEIDGVSGATVTSTGVKDAVADALAQAAK